ncbi:Dabb family protein [Rhodococcus sp. NPDC127528]|uniref:Dabb family protein n=1 Tax=unclassified Rhodococcus (in: high G+C Gram-positive bacteria) TaxID=192944 RepID=UPI003625DF9B
MAIAHVVTFSFTPEAPDDTAAVLAGRLTAVAESCTGITDFRCGGDIGLTPGTADFALTAVFEGTDAFTAYMQAPQHRAVVSEMSSLLATKSVVQFETDTAHVREVGEPT